MIKVLHLTAHLGGGVGKALSGLVLQSVSSGLDIVHTIVTLEEQEKPQFIDLIKGCGCEVYIRPTSERLCELIKRSDIIQLEWWNHPATIECLCCLAPQPMRLLVWCHVSGLHDPIIPPKLLEAAHRFLFTSPCSFKAKEVYVLAEQLGNRLAFVSSGGGFDGLPEPKVENHAPLSVGYLGSLNFAKLHPDYVTFLSAVQVPDFKVRLIGDLANREILERQCVRAGRSELLEFRGYTSDIAIELQAINVMAYLLNPLHYGTAENALLEAMSMGIVPIVLANLAERSIVEHRRTGFIVSSPGEFADVIKFLMDNPKERLRIGLNAAASVRQCFTTERMGLAFRTQYEELVVEEQRPFQFRDIFGNSPDEWFLSCQSDPKIFGEDGEICLPLAAETQIFSLLEKTKGSARHFHEFFPNNVRLSEWAKTLSGLQESLAVDLLR